MDEVPVIDMVEFQCAEIQAGFNRVRNICEMDFQTLVEGLELMDHLSGQAREEGVNAEHRSLLIRAIQWLRQYKAVPVNAVWSWNLKPKEYSEEPSILITVEGKAIYTGEIGISHKKPGIGDPDSYVDFEMERFQRLLASEGDKIYFAQHQSLCSHVQNLVAKQDPSIQVVLLPYSLFMFPPR